MLKEKSRLSGVFAKHFIFYLLLPGLITIMVVGCGSGGGGDSNGSSSPNIEAISDDWTAEDAVKDVAEVVYNELLPSLSHGTYSAEEVQGTTGNALVSGDYYFYNDVYCGSMCNKDYNDTDLIIVFTNYTGKTSDNSEATLTGTVTYSDNTWNQQSGTYYSSGGSIAVSGNDVSYDWEAWNDYKTWGVSDTITFSGFGSSIHGSFSGWCTPSNGVTYSF